MTSSSANTECQGMTFAVTKDLITGDLIHDPMNSILVLTKIDRLDIVYIVNIALRDSNRIKYEVQNIDGYYAKVNLTGFSALRFRKPKHLVVMYTECTRQRIMFNDWFLAPLLKCMSRYRKKMSVDYNFDPKIPELIGPGRFDRCSMNIGSLSTIILEGINIPYLPEKLGHKPISYISLSKSKLGLSTHEPETFWNWMSEPIICNTLKVLELNSTNLKSLPLEIIFLRELSVLSVSHNNLVIIPHLIGELKKLNSLFINDNKLRFLPECFQTRTFELINYSNNDFTDFDYTEFERTIPHSTKIPAKNQVIRLSCLSLFCLVNNHVRFKRQELCLTVVKHFNNIFRCPSCHKLMIHEGPGLFQPSFVKTKCFVKTNMLHWQYFRCNYACVNFECMFPYFRQGK